MSEHTFADFSGGMNSLAAVDKLDPKECLLAENVRLDETGNILSAGAVTKQNSVSYGGPVHSLYWNPSLGGVAGVGTSVFIGAALGSMSSGLSGQNTAQQKMSFASAPNRVYFDVGSVGYWSDMANLITVDWPSPIAVGATVTGPTLVGTGVGTGTGSAWTTPNNITSTQSGTWASITLNTFQERGQFLRATMSTNSFAISTVAVTGIVVTFNAAVTSIVNTFYVTLLKAGVPVGTVHFGQPTTDVIPDGTTVVSYSAGSSSDSWDVVWSQTDINAGTFGFQIQDYNGSGLTNTANVFNGKITIYQGVGFVAGTGTTGNLSGTYSWKVSFVAANGEESDASNPTNTVTLAAQQGTLTALQTGDARTTARNIYRKGNTLTSYYLVGTIRDNASTAYSDNQTDIAALAQGTILAGDVPGDYPNTRIGTTMVRFPVLHYDRIFWVNQSKKNQLVWSKPLNGFAYPSINFIDVGDSKPISRIVSIYGELIIIKTDSIWRLTGTDESSFDLTQTPSAVGTDESFSVVALPDKIIFANRWGLWVFNGYTSQPLTPKLDLWFKQNDRTSKSLFGVNGFHPPEVVSATVPLNFDAVGNSEKYVLAYAEAGQSANNAALVFDVKHGNITKRAGVNPLSLAIDPVTGFVYEGDANGFVSLLDDWNGANQKGAAANFDYQSPYIDLERGSTKSLWALEFFLNTNNQALIPSIYYDDGIASETLPAITANGLQRVVRPVQASLARKMQNFSWRLNGSLTSINASGTPQVQIIHVKALYDIRTGRARTGQ